jgi:hypothetical protein
VRDDGAPAGNGAEAREFGEGRLRVGEHKIAGFDEGSPRGYVVCEDRGVRQDIMCSPYEMHVKHPAKPQPKKEPQLCYPSKNGETPDARESEYEHPV